MQVCHQLRKALLNDESFLVSADIILLAYSVVSQDTQFCN
jgi:hypothetical protein